MSERIADRFINAIWGVVALGGIAAVMFAAAKLISAIHGNPV